MEVSATAGLPQHSGQLQSLHLKSVLAATDFSPASDRAVAEAISIARHYGAKLYVLNIVSSLGFNLSGAGAMAVAAEAAWRDMARLEDDLSRSRLLQGVEASFVVRSGCVYEVLEDTVQRELIDLVVVGTHGRRGLGRLFVGSVAEQVFRKSSCPVLTVGPRTPSGQHNDSSASERPVLFATDFGPASLEALPRAISLANQLAKRLTLLHVLSDVPEPGDHWFTAMDVIKLRDRLKAATIEQLARLIPQHAALDQEPDYLVEFGEPSQGIVRAATCLRAGMIILGLNQKTHIETASHLPWSSAYDVVCAVQCPVLTLRNH